MFPLSPDTIVNFVEVDLTLGILFPLILQDTIEMDKESLLLGMFSEGIQYNIKSFEETFSRKTLLKMSVSVQERVLKEV